MNTNRISFLEKAYREDPSDPMNLYGLALEYRETHPQKALDYLEELYKVAPNYSALYYVYSELLLEQDQLEKATEIFTEGIRYLKESNSDPKALAELQNAWQNAQIEHDLF